MQRIDDVEILYGRFTGEKDATFAVRNCAGLPGLSGADVLRFASAQAAIEGILAVDSAVAAVAVEVQVEAAAAAVEPGRCLNPEERPEPQRKSWFASSCSSHSDSHRRKKDATVHSSPALPSGPPERKRKKQTPLSNVSDSAVWPQGALVQDFCTACCENNHALDGSNLSLPPSP